MSLWKHFLQNNLEKRLPQTIYLERPQIEHLSMLARREQRSEEEIASELLAAALARRVADEDILRRWQELSPREQQVVALTCLGHTNRQMAGLLSISSETVKTHVRNALRKLGLHRKTELWSNFENWDFSEWDVTSAI